MAHVLKKNSLTQAVRHLCKYGDTDVFPHLPELAFIREEEEKVVDELAQLDVDTFHPSSAFETLGPKSRYGFRIVHQLPIIDTIALLAAVIEIGKLIEAHRPPDSGIEAYSYRFAANSKGEVFQRNRTYKDWLNAQQAFVQKNRSIGQIVSTDISDFYARISFHRLENLLDEVAPGNGAAEYVKKHIKVIRATQSFGLPVGGSAARLLAELALTDTDRALKEQGYPTTRFVDDFRIFVGRDEEPYEALAFIAEQLGINEGLSLNAAKTSVSSRLEFLTRLRHQLEDVAEEAEGAALDTLTNELYFDDQPDPDELKKLKSINLMGLLEQEVSKSSFDMGLVKVIFRALKLAKPPEAIDYLQTNLSSLAVFSKEVVLLMQALAQDHPGCFDDLGDEIAELILTPPASSVQLIRTWLLELFTRGTVPISATQLKRLNSLPSIQDKRQLHLIRGRNGDKNFFRMNKTRFSEISVTEQTCFVWGASCLPRDEYKHWLEYISPMMKFPCAQLFLKWAQRNRADLITKLNYPTVDQDE